MSIPEPPGREELPLRSPDTLTEQVAVGRGPTPDEAPSMMEGELLAGRFSLRTRLGRGGAGTVFAAFDIKVGQMVAVKILHADIRESIQLERLRREVRASRPGHPNAVAVFDLFDDGRRRFLSMELVDGRSLGLELEDLGTMSSERTISLGRQIAAALDDLHAKGLVHRDVKPGNILLTGDGAAKLCDMGLTRSTMRGGTITETEMVVGTPAYMAPEQALAGDLTAASDVYALGLTLFQCLTGEVPLQEDTAVATLMLRQQSRPPRVRSRCGDCPRWLDRLLRRMLDPNPRERPTAARVEAALAEQRFRVRLRPRRRHLLAAAAIILISAASVAGIRALSNRPAATVDVVGADVVGRDERGEELWRHTLDQPTVEVLRADLEGDGSDEVLVVGSGDPAVVGLSRTVQHSEIRVLSASGRVMTRIDPEQQIGRWPYRYRLEVIPVLSTLDLDADGWLEIVAVCRQRRYFPTEVLVYWPRWNRWDHVLSHSGSIYQVYPPRQGREPGFVFIGVNNRLAMYGVLGELEVTPPDRRAAGLKSRVSRPQAPPLGTLGLGDVSRLVDYVALMPQQAFDGRARRALISDEDGGVTATLFNRTIGLDAYLNDAEGANAGRDLREMRAGFFRLIYEMRPGYRTFSVEGIEDLRAEILADCGPLLAEPAYEAILIDNVARALARADDPDAAVQLLRPAYERLGNDDLGYRLANLEAIAGNLDAAASWLRVLMDDGTSRRAGFDAPQLMLRVAIEMRDAGLFGAAVSFVTGISADSPEWLDVRPAFWAGARLWWDETSEADAGVRSMDYSEDGDAVSCLTRWRRGTSRPGDPEAMRLFIENNPDAEGIGRVALAAALLGNGSTRDAIEACDTAATLIGEWAKDDYREHQNLELVRAIRARALLESGDRELARRDARRLSEELDPSLLPGILVAEVLAETAG